MVTVKVLSSDCNNRFLNTNHNLNHNSIDNLTLNPKSNPKLTPSPDPNSRLVFTTNTNPNRDNNPNYPT